MDKIQQLANSVFHHPALNNEFYDIWLNQELDIDRVGVFARNHYEWSWTFPQAIALIVATTDNIEAQTEHAKTLYSEMGAGEPSAAHSNLFLKFFTDLSKQMDSSEKLAKESLLENFKVLPETQLLVDGERRLYSSGGGIAAGAQLAQEWQAYTMIRQLYDGARNYMQHWSDKDAFCQACEFFYTHIAYAEIEHREQSITATYAVMQSGVPLSDIESGFNEHLDLIHNYWRGIAREIIDAHAG